MWLDRIGKIEYFYLKIFIYYTLEKLGPFILNFITTIRKFFTVVLSYIIYSHQIDNVTYIAIALVFTGNY